MEKDLIFSLDIGTRTIIGLVGEYISEDEFKIIAFSIRDHKKRNMYDGQIHDIEGVTKLVKEIVKDLEEKTGTELKKASVAAAGRALKTSRLRLDKSIDSSKEVTKLDVDALELEAVQKTQAEINSTNETYDSSYYCIGYSVVDYYLDKNRMARLEGHRGEEISVDLLATFLPQVVVESLYSVMAKSGLEVKSITLEPIAAIKLAIKPELRLLNLALVDIGAGTSDIAITKEGQIISYAMTSLAGDEITERISKEYLLDFSGSERLKVNLSKSDEQVFTDIVGSRHSLSTEEIILSIYDVLERVADEIVDRIIAFNGKAPSAVFLIGGSSQMPMLREIIADKLQIPRERVAVRDINTIDNISGLDGHGFGPDMITPVGIALEASEEKYRNFIKVYFDGKEIPVFNTDNIKVSDVLIIAGFDAKNLLPKRADDFVYYLNGKRRMVKGDLGTYPQIVVDGQIGNLRTSLTNLSQIEIVPSQVEKVQNPSLFKVLEHSKYVVLNGEKIDLFRDIRINGQKINEDVLLEPEDQIDFTEIKTLKNLLERFNIQDDPDLISVNGWKKDLNYVLANGDIINSSIIDDKKKHIDLIINGQDKRLDYDKDNFIFVDIFDYIDFDRTKIKGKLILKINGRDAEYMEELKDGDNITVSWE